MAAAAPEVAVTPAVEAPPTRRQPARNTPTLRSATREQVAEEQTPAVAAETPEPAPEPAKPARPACNRKRGREAIEDEKKPTTDAPPEKIKRTWEKWSLFDKTIFFEALNEFGKNFELLQNYIAKKKSKNGSDQVRNRDQIRFFYYRTLNKISKYVTFPAEVKRYIQETYLLVNYGELRKRMTKLNERSGQRLHELVYRGSTTVRLRGKTYRIRTPVCRALKKINRIHEPVEEPPVRLPARAQLELTPADHAAWYRVQAVAHNPRLRVYVPLQHRLCSLLLALECKWRDHAERALEAAFPDQPPPPPARRLVLRAAAGHKLRAQLIRPAPPPPALNLSFQRYLERVLEPAPSPAPSKPAAVKDEVRPAAPSTPAPPGLASPPAVLASIASPTAAPPAAAPPTTAPPAAAALAAVTEARVSSASPQLPDCSVRLDFSNILNELRTEPGVGGPAAVVNGAGRACADAEEPAAGTAGTKVQAATGDGLLSPVSVESRGVVDIFSGVLGGAEHPCLQLESSNSADRAVEDVLRDQDPGPNCPAQEQIGVKLEGALENPGQHMEIEVKETKLIEGILECPSQEQEPVQLKQEIVVESPVQHQEQEAEARRREEQEQEQLQRSELETGWTAETAGTRTVGELYMMLDRPEKIRLQYFWLPEHHEGAPPSPCQKPLAAGPAADEKQERHVEGSRVKMLTSLLGQLLSVARLSKVKLERSRTGSQASVGTQTASAVETPVGGREHLYYVSASARQAGSDPLRRPVRIAPAYKMSQYMPPVPPPSGAGEMRPPLEAALRALPKSNNRRGRIGRKSQVVVQRMLPLMPRTQPSQISMVNLRLVTGASQTAGSFLPVASVPVSAAGQSGITISMPMVEVSRPSAVAPSAAAAPAPADTGQPRPPSPPGEAVPPVLHIPDAPPSSNLEAPPGSPPPPPAPLPDDADLMLNGASSDLLMDITLANSNSSFTGLLASLGRTSGGDGVDPGLLQTPTRPLYDSTLPHTSPPASPRAWGEMGDFSLSSILGHLETSRSSLRPEPPPDAAPQEDDLAAGPSFAGGASSSQGLPTSFQFGGLVSGDSLGQSPPT